MYCAPNGYLLLAFLLLVFSAGIGVGVLIAPRFHFNGGATRE